MILFKLYHNRFLFEEAPENGGGGGGGSAASSASGRPSLANPAPDPTPADDEQPNPPPPSDPGSPQGDPPSQGDYVLTFDDTFSGDETLQQLLTETGKAHGLPVEGLSAFIKDMDARLAAKAAEQKQAQDAAMEEAWRQLDGEWGRDSDARQMRAVQMAGRLCRMAGIDQSVFNEMGIADHPAMYRILDAVGRILDEPALPAPPGRQEQQARGEARRMMHDPEHPDYFLLSQSASSPMDPRTQKGASREDIVNMDRWMQAYAVLTARQFPHADPMVPGTGAAGGLGFAFLSYMNAVLEPGASIVLEETSLESFIQNSDIVITGEGRLDGQTAMGKAPIAVARLAKKYGKPVFAFSGCVTPDAIQCNDAGIDAFFPILRSICSLEEAMEPASARKNLSDTVEQVMRVVRRFS